MKKNNIILLIFFIAIPLIIGFVGSLLGGPMDLFETLKKPVFAPPKILFPIVWSIIYILLGISSYLVYKSNSNYKKRALSIYAIQLIINMFWTFFFFRLKMFLFAFIWLLLLIVFVIVMIYYFYKSNKKAAYLQLLYLVWIIFASILNFSIYLLN